jgi:hypothetical protein
LTRIHLHDHYVTAMFRPFHNRGRSLKVGRQKRGLFKF